MSRRDNGKYNTMVINVSLCCSAAIVIAVLIGNGPLLILSLLAVFVVPFVIVMADNSNIVEAKRERQEMEMYQPTKTEMDNAERVHKVMED